MKRVWMDQGGTFTDVVRVSGGHWQVDKVLSDRADLLELGAGCAERRRLVVCQFVASQLIWSH